MPASKTTASSRSTTKSTSPGVKGRRFKKNAHSSSSASSLAKELGMLRELLTRATSENSVGAVGITHQPGVGLSKSELKRYTILSQAAALCSVARKRAQAPYSAFKVGAVIVDSDSTMTVGVNVESSSYGLTICAERSALVSALSQGHTTPVLICVFANTIEAISPCGACRQLLADYAPQALVLMMSSTGKHQLCTLRSLLPAAFGSEQLSLAAKQQKKKKST